jgi:aconitate hydratase
MTIKAPVSLDSFKCRKTLNVDGKSHIYFSLPDAEKNGLAGISKLPFSMKVLLENLLRNEDGASSPRPTSRTAAWLVDWRRQGDRIPAGPGADAGFHRCAGGR